MTLLDPGKRTLVLGLLCVASFASVFNNLIIAPILPEISDDLGVRVAIGGLLVTAYAVVGGIAAFFSGPIIDRIGRKPVVVTGMSILTVATALSSIAPTFELLMAARALAGLGVACLTPAVFSAVGDYFSYQERGRAMSWVISANTSASIFGVPAGAVISDLLSWRLTFVLLGVLCTVFSALLFFKLPADPPKASAHTGNALAAIPRVIRDVPTVMTIISSYLATSSWFVLTTYLAAYFHDEFGLASWALGGLTMVMGLGILIGSNFGGRISDSAGKRPVILISSAICAVFILLATTAAPHITVAFAFLLIFATANGARFASSQAIMTEMSPANRGTVMSLNASGQQFGIVTGSALGGLVLDAWGYTALGPTAAILATLSLVSYWLFVDERKLDADRLASTTPAGAK